MKRRNRSRVPPSDPTRRLAIQTLLAVPMLGLAACGTSAADSAAVAFSTLAPTPACADADDDPTPSQTEGPYFTPNSPRRTSLLEAGLIGTRLILSGRILSTGCAPIAGALLDFWQADDAGSYDNAGYRLRGHQFSDGDGRFSLETIVPGLYPGRTRHLHVKVQPPNSSILTTQLYFPGEPRNATDNIYSPELLMAVTTGNGEQRAEFNFVLQV